MRPRLASLFAGLLVVFATILGTLSTSAEAAVKRLIFASAGFHESNRFWTIARPDHLQFEPFWETLVGMDPKTGDPIPQLATKWEHSPDFKDWTFHLRKGVQFHYGFGEMTSADVVHSHSLLIRKDSTATLRPLWVTVDEMETPDKYTVVFRFKNPIMPPVMMFAVQRSGDLRIASKAQWDKEGIEGLDKRPAGTGPFMYGGRQTGLNILFKRNPNHWSGRKVEYEELEFRIAREEATRLALLLSGDVHIGDLPRELHKDALAKGLKRFSSSLAVDWVSVYLGGNWHIKGHKHFDPKAPLVNKKVRQVLRRHSLVEESVIEKLLADNGTASLTEKLLADKLLDEGNYLAAIAQETGIPPMDVSKLDPTKEALELLQENLANYYGVIPISKLGKQLTLAISDPYDIVKLDDIAMVTTCTIRPVLSSDFAIKAAPGRTTNSTQTIW